MTARARWKELCLDTTGRHAVGQFYADILGLRFEPDEDDGNVVGATEGQGIAICRVPEEKRVKHRVHIDVHARSLQELVERGAEVVRPAEESGLPWSVMRDPDGGEFCAFLRDDVPDYRFFQVVVDAVDAEEIARWWASVFDVEATSHSTPDWWGMKDVPGMGFERLTFGEVPEPKTVKNRLHWDVYGVVGDLEAAGATVLRAGDDEIGWTVMADPEGNEFCVFAPVV